MWNRAPQNISSTQIKMSQSFPVLQNCHGMQEWQEEKMGLGEIPVTHIGCHQISGERINNSAWCINVLSMGCSISAHMERSRPFSYLMGYEVSQHIEIINIGGETNANYSTATTCPPTQTSLNHSVPILQPRYSPFQSLIGYILIAAK